MILNYKYRIKDRRASRLLRQHAYSVNQVWNYCAGYQKDIESRYRAGAPKRRWPTHFDLTYLTSGTSKELGIHSETIGEICRRFAEARNRCHHSPKFRSSGGARRSLGWIPFRKTSVRIDGNRVTYLGKSLRFWQGGRPLPEGGRGGCFVEDARGRWYVSFAIEFADDLPCGGGIIGIDLGLKVLAACSDGSTVRSHHHYRRYETVLSTARRAGNLKRAKAIHAKIANARRDYLHKASTKIARENSLIVVGNVNAARLKQTKMAKSVSDAGWSMFRNQLRYKASRHGARYVEADERFTSQTCSSCGVIPDSSPKGMGTLGIRRWECSECGAVHDRDVNAAINILNAALSAQRRGDESRGRAFGRPDKHDIPER